MTAQEQQDREAINRPGSQAWADTQQPLKNGKPNHDFYKVYGEQALRNALKQDGLKIK